MWICAQKMTTLFCSSNIMIPLVAYHVADVDAKLFSPFALCKKKKRITTLFLSVIYNLHSPANCRGFFVFHAMYYDEEWVWVLVVPFEYTSPFLLEKFYPTFQMLLGSCLPVLLLLFLLNLKDSDTIGTHCHTKTTYQVF